MTSEVRSTSADKRPATPRRGRERAPSPLRTCIITKQELPQDHLIRFVIDPGGAVVADLAGKLPGRGVYVTATRAAVAEAARKGVFARGFKRQVTVADGLVTDLDGQLERASKQAFSLARKAGLVTTGFQKVDAEISAGRAEVLLHARDGRPDGIGKLDRKFRAVQSEKGGTATIFTCFSSDDLSLAIGGENVIHAAMAAGGQTRAFVRCVERLQHFRMTSDARGAAGADEFPVDNAFSGMDQAGTDQNERYE